ncbi:MAG TPA: hypothetical protein VM074_04350 [Solimonas sp.]|nr:hypothetical protein [Solimonas sp.]
MNSRLPLALALLLASGLACAGGNGVSLATTSGTGSIWVSDAVVEALAGTALKDVPPNPGLVKRLSSLPGARELDGGAWRSPPLLLPDKSLIEITVDRYGKITGVQRISDARN